MPKNQEKILIIDGNSLFHRAWHAIPPLTTKDGILVNAVYGFTSILLKALKDIKPDFIAMTFDLAEPTFRHKKYKPYKANREKQPDDMYDQMPYVKQIVEALNIPIFEKAGFEADDVIATICELKSVDRPNTLSIVATGDKDTFQLIDENTVVYTLKQGISDTTVFDIKAVKDKFNIKPEQMIDYKAMRGDPSDNIPGVPGIGDKTAVKLLNKFETLEDIYDNIEKNTKKTQELKPRTVKLLTEHKEEAFLAKELVTLVRDVPIDFDILKTKQKEYNKKEIFKLFQKFEFKTLLNKLPQPVQTDLFEQPSIIPEKKERVDYVCVDDDAKFVKFLSELKKQKHFCFDTESTGLDPYSNKLLGISFSWKPKQAYYVVVNKNVLEKLKPVFEDQNIKKIAHNFKFDEKMMHANGIDTQGVYFDTMIASYLLAPNTRAHGLDNLIFNELGHEMIPISDLIGKGKQQLTLDQVKTEKVCEYSCEDADFTYRLYEILKPKLKENNLEKLFHEIEMPQVKILADMERVGVKIDTKLLKNFSKKLKKQLDEIEKQIYDLAGMDFNIKSPVQLKEILFDKLQISTEGVKKIKSGYSTAADVLELLKDKHEIIPLIMQHRELAKLKSTYVDALPKLVNKDDRIHTSYNQTVTATGRLSSSDPNLQNIPIKTELGQTIRKAFIPKKGFKILSADYSQIELRITASVSEDKKMISYFKEGKDIHTATAADINDVKLEEVTKEMRRKAKEINFGIIYGMGPQGLAQRTGITFNEAREFIDKYFATFPNIKKYIDSTIAQTEKDGFVKTLFDRVRPLPEINSGIAVIRNSAQRMAVNAPIQGTAADILKIAMIKVHADLKKVSPESNIILQVHDEIDLEVPEKDINKVAKFLTETMELKNILKVPIVVNVEFGDNWQELIST